MPFSSENWRKKKTQLKEKSFPSLVNHLSNAQIWYSSVIDEWCFITFKMYNKLLELLSIFSNALENVKLFLVRIRVLRDKQVSVVVGICLRLHRVWQINQSLSCFVNYTVKWIGSILIVNIPNRTCEKKLLKVNIGIHLKKNCRYFDICYPATRSRTSYPKTVHRHLKYLISSCRLINSITVRWWWVCVYWGFQLFLLRAHNNQCIFNLNLHFENGWG